MQQIKVTASMLNIPTDTPSYVPSTAWMRHGPFAMWLVRAMQPRRIVELGTHHGYSYFCFCQAVEAENLAADCFAVDTWAGDEHAGYYDDSVYAAVRAENEKYSRFSTLLKKTFAEALEDIPDASVDLLHVDGRHFYNDVREDFESWIPKLSNRAIVLFHDTEVRERDFGVWRYWSELAPKHPSLNFTYQHGLGVLFWGEQIADGLKSFVALIDHEDSRTLITEYFEAQGEAFVQRREQEQLSQELTASVDRLRSELKVTQQNLTELTSALTSAQEELAGARSELAQARRYPLRQLKAKMEFKVLRLFAKAERFISVEAAERFRRSAMKRDPDRLGH